MKVAVIGATGGSGLAATQALLDAGHHVTAFARRPERLAIGSERLTRVAGDATRPADLTPAVAGHDAVLVTLGISENPLRVRLFGTRGTPLDIRSAGTRHVVEAMREQGVRRLVVQTTYGVGATRRRLRFVERLLFSLLLAPQIADSELQDELVAQSGLDWTLVQPVHLTDAPGDEAPFVSSTGETARMSVSRRSLGRFLAQAVQSPQLVGKSVAVSGARARQPSAAAQPAHR